MQWVDFSIIAIVGVSSLVSLFRGLVREAISLFGWVAAFWVASTFMEPVAGALAGYVEAPALRGPAGFVVLFVGVLLAVALVNVFAGYLVDKTGLGGTDRVLGMIFGAARGALLVAGLVLLAGVTSLPQDPWWRESVFLRHFEGLALQIRALLPREFRNELSYPRRDRGAVGSNAPTAPLAAGRE